MLDIQMLGGKMFTDIPESLAQDPWFKIVEFLQQNWAVVIENGASVLLAFYGDSCGVFDEIEYGSVAEAEAALKRNGFSKFRDNTEAREFIGLPNGEFRNKEHPNGRIYSSGRYWRE